MIGFSFGCTISCFNEWVVGAKGKKESASLSYRDGFLSITILSWWFSQRGATTQLRLTVPKWSARLAPQDPANCSLTLLTRLSFFSLTIQRSGRISGVQDRQISLLASRLYTQRSAGRWVRCQSQCIFCGNAAYKTLNDAMIQVLSFR